MKKNITFETVIYSYIQDRDLSKATIKHLISVVNLFKKDNSIKYLDQVSKDILNDWKILLINRTSDVSCNNYMRHLKALYNYAFEEEIITQNPFSRYKMVRVLEKKYKSISVKDIKILINYLHSESNVFQPGWFWVIVIKTLFYTGMRRRQIVGIKWSDINFNKQEITLRADSSKNKRRWIIPLHSSIHEELLLLQDKTKNAYNIQNNDKLKTLQVFNITLFNHRFKGSELKSSQVSGFFRKLSTKTNVKCSTHRFRHKIATDLVNGQKNIKDIIEVQHLLGHTDIKTTMGYIEKDITKLKESLEGLETLI